MLTLSELDVNHYTHIPVKFKKNGEGVEPFEEPPTLFITSIVLQTTSRNTIRLTRKGVEPLFTT